MYLGAGRLYMYNICTVEATEGGEVGSILWEMRIGGVWVRGEGEGGVFERSPLYVCMEK